MIAKPHPLSRMHILRDDMCPGNEFNARKRGAEKSGLSDVNAYSTSLHQAPRERRRLVITPWRHQLPLHLPAAHLQTLEIFLEEYLRCETPSSSCAITD